MQIIATEVRLYFFFFCWRSRRKVYCVKCVVWSEIYRWVWKLIFTELNRYIWQYEVRTSVIYKLYLHDANTFKCRTLGSWVESCSQAPNIRVGRCSSGCRSFGLSQRGVGDTENAEGAARWVDWRSSNCYEEHRQWRKVLVKVRTYQEM